MNKTIDKRAKKHFGQNFLNDYNVLKKIILNSRLDKETTAIEIGPGLGALTRELVKVSNKVIAYEIDKDIIPRLKDNLKGFSNYEIIEEDILNTDLSYINGIEGKKELIANIPYYITSPIIDLFITKLNINTAILMVQKEVADRLSAKVNTKDYNSFTIMVNYYSEVTKLFNVPRDCFTPKPNVDSAVIKIAKFNREFKPNNEEFFIKLVYASFKERRKTLINNISNFLKVSKDELELMFNDNGFDSKSRAENLEIDDFIKLSNVIGDKYEFRN